MIVAIHEVSIFLFSRDGYKIFLSPWRFISFRGQFVPLRGKVDYFPRKYSRSPSIMFHRTISGVVSTALFFDIVDIWRSLRTIFLRGYNRPIAAGVITTLVPSEYRLVTYRVS